MARGLWLELVWGMEEFRAMTKNEEFFMPDPIWTDRE
jgi:hypothetical protein